jgi:outer membrane beta-barrel protein
MRTRTIPMLAAALLLVAAATPAAARKPSDEEVGDQLERDLEKKWGRTRAVQVVVDRLYPKRSRFEIDVFFGVLPNDAFLLYLTPGLRLAWHFTEQFALELGGAYSLGVDTALRRQLEADDALIQARLRDRVIARFGLAAVWSPIYGKLAVTNRRVAHFDMYFLFEAGGVYTDGEESLGLKGGVWPEVGLGLGLRFFVAKRISLRFEFRQRLAIREGLGEDSLRLAFPSEISLGLAFLLGGSAAPKDGR